MDIPFVKADQVAAGTVLTTDGGFDCLADGERLIVSKDDHGLYVSCSQGKHYLIGQLCNIHRDYLGFYLD